MNLELNLEFSGEIWFWEGGAPWYLVTVQDEYKSESRETSPVVSYRWGMIP